MSLRTRFFHPLRTHSDKPYFENEGDLIGRLFFQTVPPDCPCNRTSGWHWNAGLVIHLDDKGTAPSEKEADESVINFLRVLKGSLEAHLETISEVLQAHEEENSEG